MLKIFFASVALLAVPSSVEAWSIQQREGGRHSPLIQQSRKEELVVMADSSNRLKGMGEERMHHHPNRFRFRKIPLALFMAGVLMTTSPVKTHAAVSDITWSHATATISTEKRCAGRAAIGSFRNQRLHQATLLASAQQVERISAPDESNGRVLHRELQRSNRISVRGGDQTLGNIPTAMSSLVLGFAMPKKIMFGLLGAFAATMLYQYRKAIGERLRKLQNESILFGGLRMTRVPLNDFLTSEHTNDWSLFELDDTFKSKYSEWKFISLGEYLATLRPGAIPEPLAKSKMLPSWIRSEIEAALTASMLKILGPSLGRAFLPALGAGPIGSIVEKATSSISDSIRGVDSTTDQEDVADNAFLPVSLLGIMALSETGATKAIDSKTKQPTDNSEHSDVVKAPTPIEKMKLGEFGISPSLAQSKDGDGGTSQSLIPNPFIVSEHWLPAIHRQEATRPSKEHGETSGQMEDEMRDTVEISDSNMEQRLDKMESYDPFAKNMAAPVPVNERLFPDLYMGWGDAKCTHTHREVLQNRLLCVLLNRLASNYHGIYSGKTEDEERPFVVKLTHDGKEVTRPQDLIDELLKAGNEIRMVVTTHPTSFGAALCVKGSEGDWASIPLAVFVNSGYENSDGKEAQALLPHSGLNLELKGPLIGAGERLTIQHFIGVEGFCGWKSNHYADVPWLKDIECGPAISGAATIDITRAAALYGLLLNIVGTEMELPLGGYGMVGVCNDSAAIMEYIMHGETHVYPLTAMGKYSVQVMRRARDFQRALMSRGFSDEARFVDALVVAMTSLPSDIHACPSCVKGAADRMLHCLPRDLPFKLMAESKIVNEQLVNEAEVLLEPKVALNA